MTLRPDTAPVNLSDLDAHWINLADVIATKGYCVIDDFLSEDTVRGLENLTREFFLNGLLARAGTGKTARINTHLRGDLIRWLDEEDQHPAVKDYFTAMLQIKSHLNATLFMNLHALESHLACYPIGSVYQKHLDQFSHQHASPIATRQLSTILYLNRQWTLHDGGQLRLYLDQGMHEDILPIAGRLVMFLSGKFWHEVLPAKRERLSLTGWFRTRD